MTTYKCTKKEIKKLPNFKTPKNTYNTESYFKIFKTDNKTYLLKVYKNPLNFIGMDTIHNNILTFIKNQEIFKESLPSIILPEHLIYIDNNFLAHTMEYIEGINISRVLSSSHYTNKDKIKLLIEIGKLLETFGKIKGFKREIYLGDVHEDNFILDKNGNLRICDCPSCHILGNGVTYSKYLEQNHNLYNVELSQKYEQNLDSIIIPNRNTDIFCYSFMILNFLSKSELQFLKLKKFINYIDYLSSLKINKEFLDSLVNLFTLKDNISPMPYLETLTDEQIRLSDYATYKLKHLL